MKSIVLILFIFIFSISARGELKDFSIGVGNLSRFYKQIQTDENGSMNSWEFNPYLAAEIEWNFFPRLSVYPSFGFNFPEKGRDENITRMTFFTILPVGYRYHDFLARMGTGLYMIRISADGGTNDLNDGLGTTSFPVPDGAATSINVITYAGLEYFAHKKLSIRAEIFVLNIIDSLSRSYCYTAAINYHFENFNFSGNKQGNR